MCGTVCVCACVSEREDDMGTPGMFSLVHAQRRGQRPMQCAMPSQVSIFLGSPVTLSVASGKTKGMSRGEILRI